MIRHELHQQIAAALRARGASELAIAARFGVSQEYVKAIAACFVTRGGALNAPACEIIDLASHRSAMRSAQRNM